ncbi:hypothetical protein SLEP1_g27128 [Rubroshorea leprosula]|uniref:Uncharacterized protein n=1 Tax=Rubroshorea leprosula TaxID=152421 RepID=A0AAV5K1Z2_9ROSI|nr:hypothetical protein SLEP1_g27128 [Rubroshorea leprosula]
MGRSERKKKHRKRMEKVKTESEKKQSEDRVVEQNNSGRLRLVISVFKDEGRVLEGDEHKEEIIHGHDDYPSSKRNDSNDKGIRREFPQHSHFAHEKIRMYTMNKEKKLMFLTSESTVLCLAARMIFPATLCSGKSKKFRGGMQTSTNIQANQKDKNNANVNTLSKEKPESVWLKSTIEDGSRVVTASQIITAA